MNLVSVCKKIKIILFCPFVCFSFFFFFFPCLNVKVGVRPMRRCGLIAGKYGNDVKKDIIMAHLCKGFQNKFI